MACGMSSTKQSEYMANRKESAEQQLLPGNIVNTPQGYK